jgi:putative phage-type endonuclease
MAEQGTLEWKLERVGKATASCINTIVERNAKGGFYADRGNYAFQLAVEQITGVPTEIIPNAFMIWGTEKEPEAREAYAATTFDEILQVGFIPHPYIENSGASPDGLVGHDGTLEIKCPQTKTHVATLLSKKVPEQYLPQIAWQFACMPERNWCDFVSYDPRMPEKGRMIVIRVERDPVYVATLEEQVKRFLEEDVGNLVKKIKDAMESL